jgi:sulfide:quinone oxidoreductase
MKGSRVVICGGGVAALESLLALRELLPLRPQIDLVAPNHSFGYHPMAVAAPFGLATMHPFALRDVAAELDARLHATTVSAVDGERRRVELANGDRLDYDAAIVAVGARPRPWLDGALAFEGTESVVAFCELLERIADGETWRLAFTAPAANAWVLPMYELALLTASWLAEARPGEVELTVVTPEKQPLSTFGSEAGELLRSHLSDRGIRLRAGAPAQSLQRGALVLASGESVQVDEVVALPMLHGPRLPGLPADADGFVPVDVHGRVRGLPGVYAAGDGTSYPLKQGGIAAQQADAAAESVAAALGAPVQPSPFAPQIRAMLLTGVAPIFLRAADARTQTNGEVAAKALWWPATKVAARYLGPYLARATRVGERQTLVDRRLPATGSDEEQAAEREARELALTCAEADAHDHDFDSALKWLQIFEQLWGVLPWGYPEKRRLWERLAGD